LSKLKKKITKVTRVKQEKTGATEIVFNFIKTKTYAITKIINKIEKTPVSFDIKVMLRAQGFKI